MVRSTIVGGLASLLVGCHVYQPLIGHAVDRKALAKLEPQTCVSGEATLALQRACVKRSEIEYARATHQILGAAVANTLIPTAGYVAYRTARDKSAAATSAIAAVGLAGYATVGALAPDGRIEAYTRASKALSCAIETYRTAYVSGLRTSLARLAYAQAVNASADAIRVARAVPGVPPTELDTIRAAEVELTHIKSIVNDGSATSLLDAQLEQFVSTTIEDLNGLLRGTLPTLNALSSDVAMLGGAIKAVRLQSGGRSYELDEVYARAAQLLDMESAQRLTADFSPCQMSTAALVAQGLYKTLALGPGNSQQGQTINLTAAQVVTIPIVGGAVPWSVVVSGDPAAYRPSAEITMQGVALLTVRISSQDAAEVHTYRVTVFDNVGSSRWADFVVPQQ